MYLAAVSGGRDSVALLHGLHALGFRRLIVCHLNHGLRGRAALRDARFTARLAGTLGYPIATGRADTRSYARERGISLETAARELRQVFFAACSRRHGCRKVLLAHHAEDQIETCLFNLLRGTGAAGLAGMRMRNDFQVGARRLTYLRPMLRIRREGIGGFLQSQHIRWREDATNEEMEHSRNRIRHQVLPVLEQALGPGCGGRILRAAEILRAEDEYLAEQADALKPRGGELPVTDLLQLPLALRRRVLRNWLARHGVAEPGFREVEEILAMAASKSTPAKTNLPGGRHARRRAGLLFVT